MAIFPVTIKEGVRFDPLTAVHVHLLAALDAAAEGIEQALVITAARDSHPPGDTHTLGNAIDISVRGLTAAQTLSLYGGLRTWLGDNFTVLFESPVDPPDETIKPIVFVNPKATGPHLHLQLKKGLIALPR